jgi:hypothetical protein
MDLQRSESIFGTMSALIKESPVLVNIDLF